MKTQGRVRVRELQRRLHAGDMVRRNIYVMERRGLVTVVRVPRFEADTRPPLWVEWKGDASFVQKEAADGAQTEGH